MASERIERGLQRIALASSRIETAAKRARKGDADLARKHEALKAAVQDTLAEIDDMIGESG